MLDPKWHDIRETVLNYLRKVAKYQELSNKTEFLTIHASN
jgi:orotidine-5'-phosphate decarboxylase